MTQASALRASRPAPRPSARRAALRVVPTAIQRTRVGVFAGACMALLVVGLLTLLILNTQLAQGTYVLKDLGKREVALIDQKLELNRSIDAQRSPGSLAAKAKALGMVPASSMAFIELESGKIIGEARPAGAAPAAPAPATPAPAAPVPAAPAAAAATAPVELPAGDAPDAPTGSASPTVPTPAS